MAVEAGKRATVAAFVAPVGPTNRGTIATEARDFVIFLLWQTGDALQAQKRYPQACLSRDDCRRGCARWE